MVDIVDLSNPVGAILTGAHLLTRLGGSTAEANARFIAQRSTPAGRAAEAARRGEPTRAQLQTAVLSRHSLRTPPATTPAAPSILDSVGLPTAPMRSLPPDWDHPGRIELSIPVVPYLDPFTLMAQNLPVPTQPRSGGRFDPLEGERRAARARAAQEARMRQGAERLLRKLKIIKAGGVLARAGARAGGVVAGVLVPSELGTGVPTDQQVKEAERRAREARLEELQVVTVAASRLPEPAAGPAPRVGPPRPAATGRPRSRSTTSSSSGSPATTPASSGMLGRLPWAQILLGALTGSSPRVNVSPVVNVAPSAQPLTAVETSALPSPRPPLILSGGGQPNVCDCAPKRKRGPRKKCLEWAPIRWSGGRYSGKSAGRKCVRREQ